MPSILDEPHDNEDDAELRLSDLEFNAEIEAMIIEEQDHQEKMRLLMMYKFHRTLLDNVTLVRKILKATSEHRTDFDNHIEEHNKRKFFREGAIWAGLGLQGIILVLGVYILKTHVDEDKKTRDEVKVIQEWVYKHEIHHAGEHNARPVATAGK